VVSFVLKELETKGVYQIIDIADIADIADISIGSLATSALAALKIFVQGHPDQNDTASILVHRSINQSTHFINE